MTDTITLTGVVATAPRNITTSSGLAISSFRLASTHRKFDRAANKWVDGDTNWYTISSFRQLAAGVIASVNLGERVIVTGRLRVRDWQSGDKSGTSVEVDADAVGHDLNWGSTKLTRGTAAIPTDLSGADLSGADLSGTDLRGADLGGADPAGTDPALTDPSLTDPSLTDPSLTDPSLTDPSAADQPAVYADELVGASATDSWAVAPLGSDQSTPF